MSELFRCSACREMKPQECYTKDLSRKKRAVQYTCRECKAKQHRNHYLANPEYYAARKLKPNYRELHSLSGKRVRQRVRAEVLEAYGGKCACCGEDRESFLSIDHINNDGASHRRTIGKGKIYFWLKKNNWPDGFQILCHNCNFAKGVYGSCPHTEELLGFIGACA